MTWLARQHLATGDVSRSGLFSSIAVMAMTSAPGIDSAPSVASSAALKLLNQVTCPHCWERFAPEQVLWVSEHIDLLGDPLLGPEQQQRFLPSRFTIDGDAIDAEFLDNLPAATHLRALPASEFEKLATSITLSRIALGKDRENLDWEHIRDLMRQSPDLENLFSWIAYCLEKKSSYTADDWRGIAQLEKNYA